jgi:hypothetical protein
MSHIVCRQTHTRSCASVPIEKADVDITGYGKTGLQYFYVLNFIVWLSETMKVIKPLIFLLI